MVLDHASVFVQYVFLVSGVIGFILIPALVKILLELRILIDLYKQYKSNQSDGGNKITLQEFIGLVEQSGVIFRKLSGLFKN